MFRLETERLIIRPWEPDDRPALKALTDDPEVMRYVHNGEPYTNEEIDELFARQGRQVRELGVCMGAMIEKSSNRLIGVAGIQPLGTTGEYEIGWWLARDRWGLGLATEAGEAAMRHVFDVLNRDRVLAIIDPPNEASKRVVARLGFRYVARHTGEELGHRKPEIVVDVFERDRGAGVPAAWRARRAPPS